MITDSVTNSETSVNFYQNKRREIPEDSHFHTCRRENTKSHRLIYLPAQQLLASEKDSAASNYYHYLIIYIYTEAKKKLSCYQTVTTIR
jgi:hypothetical protein